MREIGSFPSVNYTYVLLVPRNQLFCALTNRYINKKPAEVKGHIGGRKYKGALASCKSLHESEVVSGTTYTPSMSIWLHTLMYM